MNRVMTHVLLFMLPLCLFFETNDAQDGVDALLGTVDLSGWDAWFGEEAPDIPFRPSDFVQSIAEMEDPIDTSSVLERAASYIIPSVKSASGRLVLLLGLAVLAAALNGIQVPTASETAQTAFRMTAACMILTAVFAELRDVYRMLERIQSLSEWLLPVLIAFLTLGGMEHTAALSSSAFALLSDGAIRVLQGIVVPLGCIGGVLLTLDACSAGRLASIGKLMLRAAKWALGILCTGYGLFGAVRGAVAAGADGLLLRTAKLAAGSLPAVGGVVSDSVETAYQCLIYVKNAIGLCGTVLVLLVCVKPVLNVFGMRSALRAASALSEPLAGKPYADLLRGLGDTLHLLLLCELAAAALALMAIAPVLSVGRFS